MKTLLTIFLFIFITGNSAYAGLFGSKETRFESFDLFPKWASVLSRHESDKRLQAIFCVSPVKPACVFGKWHNILDSIKGKSVMEQLDTVNREMNKYPYITDLVNWQVPDYWETPREFFIKSGDCEDYAIAKYESLLYLGFSNEDLRIVVLQDLNLQVAHSVLVVYVKGKAYILDNQTEQVVPDYKIKHYLPIYSINEKHWWRHRV